MTARPIGPLCTCAADRMAGNDDVRAYVVDRPLDPVSIAELAKLLGVGLESTDWSTLCDTIAHDADARRAVFVFLSGGALC